MALLVQKEDAFLLQELETKHQELHAARRQIDLLSVNVRHLESENTDLNNALSEVTQMRKDSQSCGQGKSDVKHRDQMAELQQLLEEAQASERMAKESEKKLEQQLRFALEAAASAAPQIVDNDDEDEITLLQVQIAELENEKSSFKLQFGEISIQLKEKTVEVARLLQELTAKDEDMECMESQFNTQCSINERLREENCEMKAKLEAESGQVDTGRKGNSLFAEVDDRRVAAERKIIKLETVTRELEGKVAKEQKENKRLKLQILLLRQTSSQGYDDNMVRGLQGELLESKKSILNLTEQLQKRELSSKHKETQETRFSAPEGATDSDKLFIHFLQGIVSQKKKETEEAKSLAQQKHLQALRSELHLTEVKNEVITLTHDCDRLKVMNSHLTMSLQELQLKYEPELYAPPSKEKIKIPQSSTVTLSQNNRSQNEVNAVVDRAQKSSRSHQRKSNCEEPAVAAGPGSDKHSKENIPLKHSSGFFGTDAGKSVRMMPVVNVISSDEGETTAELKADGQGKKARKAGGGTGKYRSVTHVNIDTQPSECKQQ